MNKNSKNIFFTATIPLVFFLFLLASGANAQTWTPPTAPPPGDNVYEPINISSSAQSKIGGLLLNTGNATYGLLIPFGKVGIGTLTPSQKLSVAGIIESTIGGFKFPDGTIQITASSTGGGNPSPPAVAPTINSFTVSPTSVELGQSMTVSGSAVQGSSGSCITQHRMFVVGSLGGVWTPLGCVSTATLSGPLATLTTSSTINPRSFYSGPGTYILRWEVQDSSSQITSRDVTLIVTSSNPGGLNAPQIGSFTLSPSSVTEGQEVTVNGSVTQSSPFCITQHRLYVVGSQGGVWTPLSCVSTATLSEVVLNTSQNIRSFYNNPGTYTLRWEVQNSFSQIATRDLALTVTTGSGSSESSGGGNTMVIYGSSFVYNDVSNISSCPSGWSDTGAVVINGHTGGVFPAARTCYK